jgi:CRP/FNR family transcriptional regulator
MAACYKKLMSRRSQDLRLATVDAECRECFMEARCWPGSTAATATVTADCVSVKRLPALSPGELLWRIGAEFNALYLVRHGAIKVFESDLTGGERVLQFAFAGDLLGLEALALGHHESNAVALSESMICRLAWPPAASTAAHDAALTERLLRRASVQLRQRSRATRLADPDASVRGFLQELAAHLGREERVGDHVWLRQRLPMSRLEIGQYLGYAEETVCRSMRRLQSNGELEVSGRTLLIKKTAAATAATAATVTAAAPVRARARALSA